MIHIFFLLQTHRASTSTAKISSFKHVFCSYLSLGGHPSKEINFCGSIRLPNGLSSKILPNELSSKFLVIRRFNLSGAKTVDNERPLRVKQP